MDYLTKEEIIAINEFAVSQTGDGFGLCDMGLLERSSPSVVTAPVMIIIAKAVARLSAKSLFRSKPDIRFWGFVWPL